MVNKIREGGMRGEGREALRAVAISFRIQ